MLRWCWSPLWALHVLIFQKQQRTPQSFRQWLEAVIAQQWKIYPFANLFPCFANRSSRLNKSSKCMNLICCNLIVWLGQKTKFFQWVYLKAPLRPWSLPTLVILLRRRKSSTGAIPEHFLIILNHYSWYPGFKVLSLDLQEERKPASIGGASYRYSGILKHCSLLNVPELQILYPTLKMISGLVKTTWASLGEVNRMCIRRSPVATFWWLKLDSQAMEK